MRKFLKYIILGMAFAIPSITLSQPDTVWTISIFNAGWDLQVIRVPEGGYAIGTTAWDEDSARRDVDFALIKTDSVGNEEWRRYYAGMPDNRHNNDGAYTISLMPDSGYVLVGQSYGEGMVVRTDANGEEVWRKYLRNQDRFRPNDCVVTPDGDIVIVGERHAVKFSDEEDGEIIWNRVYENAFSLNSCVNLPDDEFLFAGSTTSIGAGSTDMYLLKVDSDGEEQWEHAYGTEESEVCSWLIPVSNYGWCLSGTSRYGVDGNDIYSMIVRIDEEGEAMWMNIYDNVRGARLRRIIETPDGGFVAIGFLSGYRYYLLRVDYAGEELWRGYYRPPEPGSGPEGYSVFVLEDNSYFLGGFASGIGCWLVRTEPDPVDFAFELEAADTLDFGELEVDSVESWEFTIANTGRRYVVIDSLWFEGDSVFACSLELLLRVEPEDTAYVQILFQPTSDTTYTATLHLHYGDEQTLEVELTGQGVDPNGVTDGGIGIPPNAFGITAFPNPFNSSTTIEYRVGANSNSPVRLSLYDLSGRLVQTLVEGRLTPGKYRTTVNANNLPSGLYMITLNAGKGQSQTQKVMLVK